MIIFVQVVVDKYVEMAPKVVMNFDCEEKAYEMYNTYAGLVGFSVRKSKTKRHKSDNSLSQKYFVCSGEGYRKNEASQWISQGPVVMLVSSLVSARRMYGLCKRS
jgi:hypothetical protein